MKSQIKPKAPRPARDPAHGAAGPRHARRVALWLLEPKEKSPVEGHHQDTF